MLHGAARFSEEKVSGEHRGFTKLFCNPGGDLIRRNWGERRDLNPRPSVPQTDALPAELRSPAWSNDNTLARTVKGRGEFRAEWARTKVKRCRGSEGQF